VAVDAAARAAYDEQVKAARPAYPAGVKFAEWENLDPNMKLQVRESVLPIVWAALSALPDPRRVAWEQGYAGGRSDSSVEEGYKMGDSPYPHENPY
jgi:hypothetical protein